MSRDNHNDRFKFNGYTNSFMNFNKTGNIWYLGIYGKTNTIWATTNGTEYPIGTHQWKIVSPSFNGIVELNLNACNDNTEFNCIDGGCIGIESRQDFTLLIVGFF